MLKVENLLSVAEGVRVKINEAHVNGIAGGMTAEAIGTNSNGEVVDYTAGGFIGKSNSCEIIKSDVKNLKEVTANDKDGFAGGFVGSSQTGGLADVAGEADVKALLNVNKLLGAVKYLLPSYTECTVTYVDKGGVAADTAGGFAGNFQSGTVNNQDAGKGNYYSVYNLDHVNGQSYAGGFGGNVYSGALADAGGGISILGGIKGLNINVGDLLNLINAYIPYVQYAGVKSDNGFNVTANKTKSEDSHSGSAGGFIGYGSGVQVSYCDVTNLKHTTVKEPKDLEADEAPTYYDENESTYAVTGARYAGGYIGYMDIGSAASVGKGLSVLGNSIEINHVLDALNVVVSTIEHSNVTGNVGGFAVKATWKNTASDASANDILGDAGGFAGKISGGHIQDSNANNFSYIIGQITAGGYVGDLEPGNVANVLGDTGILGGLVDVSDTLASLAEDFVPTIRNSSTTCVPCGGAVRADADSTTQVQRGMAGGYAGHNEGGHIWGNNTKNWKGKDYTGPTSVCKAVRIRSVYGEEIAGGFTGLMESADTASTGNLSLLWGLVKVDNILGALSVVYPTEENTAVYGPLALMDYETWNKWVEFVGKKGGYGSDLAEHGTVRNQAELDAIIGKYAYGYNVVAGRVNYRDETKLANGGAAGGYVGSMQTGTITNGQAYQAKTIKGLRCAGGFAGEMINGGAAKLGGVDILGLNLQLGQMLQVLNVFVPVIKKSSVDGYQSGLIVQSEGVDDKDTCGYAGGYVGKLIGGQIWGENDARCKVTKLRRVEGRSYVGGFVGSSRPGSVATVDPTAGEGLLSQLLNKLLSKPADLIKVLNATVATIRYADVEAWDDWGIIVNGAYASGRNNTSYAKAAGGFAGNLEGTVLGKKDTEEAGVSVQNIRSVVAGEYAGGCFGVADVAGVANISAGSETSLLDKLLQLGRTDVLDAFRSYVYYGTVNGSKDAGLSVSANTAIKSGQNNQVTYSGTAGGFGGSLLNGSVKNSKVTSLSNVRGLNSVGGFVGYSGKSGVVKADKIDVLGNNKGQLLGGALGVMDIFGSHIDDCAVTGTDDGYTVQSTNGDEQIAGGFIGYANLARMSNCTAGDKTNQKIGLKQVASGGTAGGFAGRTSFAYLADLKLDSGAVNVIFSLVNELIKALYLDKIQDSNLLKINLGIIKVDALYDGKLLHVNLLGLDISVGLSKKSTDNDQQTDLAIITIGDSSIKLPCNENGLLDDNDAKSNISVSLIKANRTRITDSNVYGVSHGYDVYAGGAGNNNDGDAKDGRSGGFVGFNDEGLLKNNNMYYCDVVRGTKDLVGPFSGISKLDSQYKFNTLEKVEGEDNNYRIYRKLEKTLDQIKKNSDRLNLSYEKDASSGGFAGRTSFAYLADLKLDSGAVNVIFSVVNRLVKALYLEKIQDSDLLKINLGIIKVDALYDGKLLHINLLGLDISVGLSKKSTDNGQDTDLAIITIGDSSIKLPCDENGLFNDNDAKSNISVSLIKANRTRITDSNVYGVSQGYDVYAGGAGYNNDGDAKDGRSGGFVGFNDEGLLKNNNMYYCDVVRGTKDLVGPFSGKSELDTVYDFNSQENVEGEKNNYRIYRKLDQSLDQIEKNNSILNSSHEKDDASGWDIYTIGHMNPVKTFETLKNAVLASKSDSVKADLNAYESPAKAVLMSDTKTTLNTGDSDTPEPSESQDPCDEHIKLTINKVWKDLNNFDHSRPNSITVTISRTWKDKAGNETTETVPGYESYKIEGSIDKSKWQEVIKELPAYKTDGDEIYYYTYSITEAKVDGYTTTIDKSQDGFTFTITNRHFPSLPDTGGYGSYLIYLIAVLLFLIYFVMRYRKCKENKKAEKL